MGEPFRQAREVFAEQKDFAVRTFGMPDNPGYLGVCFGSVITANGPAAGSDFSVTRLQREQGAAGLT